MSGQPRPLRLLAARPATAGLDPDQFAVGWALEPGAPDGTFLGVPLPYAVYRESGGLAKLAVLDSGGELMPFYRLQQPGAATATRQFELGTSPLYGDDGRLHQTDLELTRPDERTLKLRRRQRDGARVAAYLVDATAVQDAPTRLALQWRALEQPFLVGVTIEQSEDLQTWRVVGRGSAALLRVDAEELRHEEIQVTARPGGYYRITWQGGLSDWNIERVRLTSVSSEAAREPELITLDAKVRTQEASRYRLHFDAGAPVPIGNADFALTSDNAWIEASIAYGSSADGPWHAVVRDRLFYRLKIDDALLESEPADIGQVEARYWRVSMSREPPRGLQLRLGMRRDELRIAAKGVAPYMLVGGTWPTARARIRLLRPYLPSSMVRYRSCR